MPQGDIDDMYFASRLGYKPEGRGFDPNKVIGFLISPNPSSRAIALGSTQPRRNEYQESSWE
jgi:hypothetical protein